MDNEDDLVHPIVRSNLDVYYLDETGQEKLLLKYRKNQISDELCDLGWESIEHWQNQVVGEELVQVLLM